MNLFSYYSDAERELVFRARERLEALMQEMVRTPSWRLVRLARLNAAYREQLEGVACLRAGLDDYTRPRLTVELVGVTV